MTTDTRAALVDWQRLHDDPLHTAHILEGYARSMEMEGIPGTPWTLRKAASHLRALVAPPVSAAGEEEQEKEYVTIANLAQETTGRSVWPSTVKAVLGAAAALARPAEGEEETCPKCHGTGAYQEPGVGGVICDCRDLWTNMARGLTHLPDARPAAGKCPSCGSGNTSRNTWRNASGEPIATTVCRNCGNRFDTARPAAGSAERGRACVAQPTAALRGQGEG